MMTPKFILLGQVLECSLAKPQADQRSSGFSSSSKAALLPSYQPPVGYGLVGGAYGALSAGYGGAGFGQVEFFLLTYCVSSRFILFFFLLSRLLE